MPRMFAVQLKDEAAERYENFVNTQVYTQDFEGCVGWLGDELPDRGHPCEFAGLAGDGAVYCTADDSKLRAENAKLRELVVRMYYWMGRALYDGSCRESEYEDFEDAMREIGIGAGE